MKGLVKGLSKYFEMGSGFIPDLYNRQNLNIISQTNLTRPFSFYTSNNTLYSFLTDHS